MCLRTIFFHLKKKSTTGSWCFSLAYSPLGGQLSFIREYEELSSGEEISFVQARRERKSPGVFSCCFYKPHQCILCELNRTVKAL